MPSGIRSTGTLTVAADATYAPNEFIAPDGHTVIGMDADLAKALGQVMGLKVNVTNATFDTILPGLQSGKYDLGMSSFTDTREREKIVDFVTYFVAGTSSYVKSSGGPPVTSLADLCGRTVAAEKGTTQQADAQGQSAKCRASGKPAVTVQVYNDQNAVNLALSSGRAQVAMADSPVAEYQVKQSKGAFKISGPSYGTAPYGIAVPKNSGMTQPVLAALNHLMDDGTYLQILKKWGLQSGAISNPGHQQGRELSGEPMSSGPDAPGATQDPTEHAAPPEEIRAIPVRHPGRWVAAAVVLLLAAMLVHTLVTNPRFQEATGREPRHRRPRGPRRRIRRSWAKREDCNSGIAYGGNKTRKLEYLVADALAKGCDTLVSIGGVQSNHTRQVAAVAARVGLNCVLIQESWVNWPDSVYDKVGNISARRRRPRRDGRCRPPRG